MYFLFLELYQFIIQVSTYNFQNKENSQNTL